MDSTNYILTVCFGVSSWVTINGIFSILPAIIDQVPEGWAIASTLGLAIQAANIGPLAYRFSRTTFRTIPAIVYGIFVVGALSMLLMAQFWSVTFDISGAKCSLPLILLTFMAALCDCTSSLVFWPFIGVLAPEMVAGLALGENLSGVVASAVSWMGLSPGSSFCALAGVILVSAVAFTVLLQRSSSETKAEKDEATEVLIKGAQRSLNVPYCMVGLMSLFENAVLPSILPYATARYSQRDYHIASTLPVTPLALLSLAWFQASHSAVLVMATAAAGAIGIIACVGLGGVDFGGGFTITAVVVAKVLIAYSKAASMYHLKVGAGHEAQKTLETAGGVMQVWSFGGAVAMFVLTHYTTVFPERP